MSSEKTDKYYKLPYDLVVDKDIHDFLESIPRNRRAEIVRFGLRYYMSNLEDDSFFKVRSNGDTKVDKAVKKKEPEKKKPSGLLFEMNKINEG